MLGTITELYLSDPQKGRHGVINAKDKNSYYFNQDSLISKVGWMIFLLATRLVL